MSLTGQSPSIHSLTGVSFGGSYLRRTIMNSFILPFYKH